MAGGHDAPPMDTGKPPNKQELLEGLLGRGMIMVTLDARSAGVDVPSRFHGDPRLSLNLSYRFGLPLEVNAWGIRATLTFGGVSHDCKIPWSAVYQVLSHVTREQFLFPENIPADLLELDAEAPEKDEEGAQKPPRGRPRLTVVPAQGDDRSEEAPAPARKDAPARTDQEQGPPEEPPPDGGGPRRGHLRRIK